MFMTLMKEVKHVNIYTGMHMRYIVCECTERAKSRFAVGCDTIFILVLLFIHYCIIFHMNNYKSPLASSHIIYTQLINFTHFIVYLL